MAEILTKSRARNVFYGGSVFFVAVFVAMTVHSHYYIVHQSSAALPLTEEVILGKEVWERNSCINCHTLHGEGAYFAPEVGNVWVRYGGKDDPAAAREQLKAWILAQPTGVEGRRQMPKFAFSDQELDDLVSFLEWASTVNTQGWPPNEAG